MGISLREIQDSDLEMIMNWRMDPDITRYMNTDPKLTLEGQRKWLAACKENNRVMHWIIEQDMKSIGLIYLEDIDWDNKTSSWGYYIGEKKARSLKTAISLEMSLYDYVFDVLNFDELHNEVFSINSGVVKLHVACGSKITEELKGKINKNGILYDVIHMSITKNEWNRIRYEKKYEKVNFDIRLIPHHIGYAVTDVEKAVKKYQMLGYYQASPIYDDVQRHIRIVFIKSKEQELTIELISPLDSESPISGTLLSMKNVSSPYHICYEVKKLEETIGVLKKRGFYMVQEPEKAIAFNNKRVTFMVNREAGLIELVEKEE